jgi:tetratricopeptide (TPR) repeat protein
MHRLAECCQGYNGGMNETPRKLAIAPFGCDTFGPDILMFEHGLFFGLEMAFETADIAFADVHEQLGGSAKRERPQPSLTESDVRRLAARAACDAFIDGMLLCTRDEGSEALSEVAVALRVYRSVVDRFEIPNALVFRNFTSLAKPSTSTPSSIMSEGLSLDYDLYIALQYRLCEDVFAAIGADLARHFTADTLQITANWDAYALFVKGKRATNIAETKLGYYEQAIKKDPNFFLALYNSAMLYKTQTDYNTARMRLMRAAAVTKDTRLLGEVYFELGLCSIYLGDPKTARNYWEKALEFGIDNPALLVNMAGTFEQEENWNEAKRINQIVIDRFPSYHKAIVNLARLHAMFGHLDLAIPLYERAIALQPGDALRHSVLGGCYLATGNIEDARVQFEQAVAIDPNGDPGMYAAQELAKLKPGRPNDVQPRKDDGERKRRGLW